MAAKAFLSTRRTKVFASGTVRKIWDVTPGGLVVFPGGTGITDPISREAKWERMHGEQSDQPNSTSSPAKAGWTARAAAGCAGEVGWQRWLVREGE